MIRSGFSIAFVVWMILGTMGGTAKNGMTFCQARRQLGAIEGYFRPNSLAGRACLHAREAASKSSRAFSVHVDARFPKQAQTGGPVTLAAIGLDLAKDVFRFMAVSATCRRICSTKIRRTKLLAEKPFRSASVVIANKSARVIRAMLTKREEYRRPVAAPGVCHAGGMPLA